MARRSVETPPPLTDDEIRSLILRFLHHRNKTATARVGKKKGAAVGIMALRKALRESHALKANQVVSNLNYLISERYVETLPVAKSFRTPSGTIVQQITTFYIITATGTDRVAGPSQFMRKEMPSIRVRATGQNVITLGDGNTVNVKFQQIAEALTSLVAAVKNSSMSEEDKKNVILDIGSIQTQFAKDEPSKPFVKGLWSSIEKVVTAAGLIDAAAKVGGLITALCGS
jgi:hypothetical protein